MRSIAAAGFALLASSANAELFSFGCFNIGSGSLSACTSGTLSYTVDVTGGANAAQLKFANTSSAGSTFVSEIYFDYTNPFGVASTTETTTNFGTDPATPANIPSGNTYPGGVFTADLGIDAENPASGSGIRNAESLLVDLSNITGEALVSGLKDGSIRIAIHVQSVTDSNGLQTSAEFGEGITPVPEPSTWAMLLAGLGVIGLMARRNTKRA